jgi:hypothetical protein
VGEVRPWRYGAVVPTTIGLERHGRWDQADGSLVWRVAIASPGAHSLGVLFGEFDLPPGGEVYLTSSQVGGMRLGAFTAANEQPNGMLAIQPLAGDRLVVEYVQPAHVTVEPRLAIASVVYDYRDVFAHAGGVLGTAPSKRGPGCLVDINCPQGQPYQDIKRSVLALFVGGFRCTGSLLNNTAQDGTPYMYTASHCGNFTNGVFAFNYELPECDSGSASLSQTLSGATLLADDDFIDNQLYLLNETPPGSFDPFYAGWGRGPNPSAPGVGISHPAGLPKKISIDNDAPINIGTQFSVGWDIGEIQGGSSGSPLFNHNQRVIGALCCGAGSCSQQGVFYGRLAKFWARKSLSQWLDPVGTGQVGLAGLDPFPATVSTYNGSGSNPDVYSSNAPALGSTWMATVDVSGRPGTTSTLIAGRSAATSGVFNAWGELLIDLGTPLLFQSLQPVVGGLSTHSAPVPNDTSLAGATAFTQAAMLGGGIQLTNGVQMTAN